MEETSQERRFKEDSGTLIHFLENQKLKGIMIVSALQPHSIVKTEEN